MQQFLQEFLEFTSALIIIHKNIICLGDFNIHIRDITNADSKDFGYLLIALGVQQIVIFPTHIKYTILNLITCTTKTEYKVSDVKCSPLLSDHFLISAVKPAKNQSLL